MSKLLKKIKDSYSNADDLITLVRKVDLQNILDKILDQVELGVENKDYEKLASLSGMFLNHVNSKLKHVLDPREKRDLEYLLADIFDDYLDIIAQSPNGSKILNAVNTNLRAACDFEGWNYDELKGVFNIEKHCVLLPQIKNERRIYYQWNGLPHELDGIAKDISDKKWIFSVREFKRLFEPIDGSLSIKCHSDKKVELLVLIHVLKEKNLIQAKGKGNSGHFAPFVNYAVDNEGNFLFSKSVNKKHNKLKEKKDIYEKLRRKAQDIIESNLQKRKGQ